VVEVVEVLGIADIVEMAVRACSVVTLVVRCTLALRSHMSSTMGSSDMGMMFGLAHVSS
jgi:hypothetical protein